MSLEYKRIHELNPIAALDNTYKIAVDKSGTTEAEAAEIATLRTILLADNVNNVNDSDYTILDDDNYTEIWIDPASADRDAVFPSPADNVNRKLKIKNVGDGTYKIVCNPDVAETFNVFSGDEEWTLATFELLQAGDWVEFISDGTNWIKDNAPYWHKFSDPDTGNMDSKVAAWTADQFTPGGLEVTFSEAPVGSVGVRCTIQQASTLSNIFYRKSGDLNISNTPNASVESSHLILNSTVGLEVIEFWLSSDLKIEIAVTHVDTDIFVFYPIGYLQ
jgi:hypothetical protein